MVIVFLKSLRLLEAVFLVEVLVVGPQSSSRRSHNVPASSRLAMTSSCADEPPGHIEVALNV